MMDKVQKPILFVDYHLLTYPRNWLQSQGFSNNKELMEGVKTWLSSPMADFLDTGIYNHIPCYDMCLSFGGDYVNK
jgi:hypothetical protein